MRLGVIPLTVLGCAIAGWSQNAGESSVRASLDVRARTTAPARDEAPAFRADVRLVLIPVSVTDPLGNPVPGLHREDFRLFEDGVQQDVRYFSMQDAPASIGIIFDSSGSMESGIDKAREAVLRLLRRSRPGDEYFLIAFSNHAQMLSTFADNTATLEHAVAGIQPEGWTALLDAVAMGVGEMKYAKNERKALIVLSDGGDNRSHLRERELRNLVRESDASIYTVGMLGRGLSKRGLRLLTDMAQDTGARMFPVKTMEDLPAVIDEVSLSLRNQYVLGFSSTTPGNGLFRTVKVGLNKPEGLPPLRALWRNGYYAPPAP